MNNFSESMVFSLIHSWIVLDLQITEKSLMEAEAKLNFGESSGFIMEIINDMSNNSAHKRIDELIEQRNEINNRLRNFKIDYGSFILLDCEFLKNFRNSSSLQKKSIVSAALMRSEFNLFNRQQILEIVSINFFNNKYTVLDLDSRITKIYSNLISVPNDSSYSIKSNVVSSIISYALPIIAVGTFGDLFPGFGAGAPSSETTHMLKKFGFGDMQRGVGVLALASAILGNYIKVTSEQHQAIKNGFENTDCCFLAWIFTANLINISLQLEEHAFIVAEREIKKTLQLLQDFREELYQALYLRLENIEINKSKLQILRNIEIQLLNVLKQ